MRLKKGFKRVFVVAMLCAFIATLTACATKLKGTYVAEDSLVSQSFTFKEDNKVVASAFDLDIEGTYAIEDDKIIITYSLLGFSYDWEKSFEKKGNSIFIDGTEFVKK